MLIVIDLCGDDEEDDSKKVMPSQDEDKVSQEDIRKDDLALQIISIDGTIVTI